MCQSILLLTLEYNDFHVFLLEEREYHLEVFLSPHVLLPGWTHAVPLANTKRTVTQSADGGYTTTSIPAKLSQKMT